MLGLGPVIAVYLGLLLVVAACVALVAVYWDALGSWGVLALSARLPRRVPRRERDPAPPRGSCCRPTSSGPWRSPGSASQRTPSRSSRASGPRTWTTSAGSTRRYGDRGRRPRRGAALLALRPTPLLLVPIAAGTVVLVLALDAARLRRAPGRPQRAPDRRLRPAARPRLDRGGALARRHPAAPVRDLGPLVRPPAGGRGRDGDDPEDGARLHRGRRPRCALALLLGLRAALELHGRRRGRRARGHLRLVRRVRPARPARGGGGRDRADLRRAPLVEVARVGPGHRARAHPRPAAASSWSDSRP